MHRLEFHLDVTPGAAPAVTINGRPVQGVTRWSIIADPGHGYEVQVEVLRWDDAGQPVRKKGLDGLPLPPSRLLRVDENGAPEPGPDGSPQWVDGEPEYEKEVLRGVMLANGASTVTVTGLLPLTAPNLDLAERLSRHAPEVTGNG